MGPDQRIVDGEVTDVLVLQARRVEPDGVSQDGDHVGLVDGAGPTDEVAEVRHGALDVAGEAFGRVGGLPAAALVPARAAFAKWWKVTTGETPRSCRAAHMRR